MIPGTYSCFNTYLQNKQHTVPVISTFTKKLPSKTLIKLFDEETMIYLLTMI